jgi:hypothetical protein
MRKFLLVCVLVFSATFAYAVDSPTTQEIQKVVNFYFNGQGGGVVLVEHKLCEGIHKEGDEKYNCKNEIPTGSIAKGEKGILWMNFFGPEGDKYDVLVQFSRGGLVRHTTPLKVAGAFRYRANASLLTKKPGNWTVKIFNDAGDEAKLLATTKYTVTDTE